MAEFTPVDHTPGEGGGGGKKKGKLGKNQKMLMIGGGVAVVFVALLMSKSKGGGGGSSQEAVEEQLKDYYTNYPTMGNQNSVVQDGMNTLVGRQEELLNSILEIQGKKDPEVLTQGYATFANSDEAMKAQNYLINAGAKTTYVKKQYIENGWEGSKDYYVVSMYDKDREEVADLIRKGVQDKQWNGMAIGKPRTQDAPSYGSHTKSY